MDEGLAGLAAGYAFDVPAVGLGRAVKGEEVNTGFEVVVPLAMLNRHGLVAGATGTGKTKTVQGLAGRLSDAGVPCFVADIKGDVSGMAEPGEASDKVAARIEQLRALGPPSLPGGAAHPVGRPGQGGAGAGLGVGVRGAPAGQGAGPQRRPDQRAQPGVPLRRGPGRGPDPPPARDPRPRARDPRPPARDRSRSAPAPSGGVDTKDLIEVGKLALRFMNTPAGRQIQRSIFGVLRKRR